MSIEWERKFDLAAPTVVPRLAGAGPIAAVTEPRELHLDATYFDTKGFRLARAGITLRRRAGGDDEGWHLKLPIGPERREEIHLPLTEARNRVPAELVRLLTARTNGRKLAPIAHLATVRQSSELVDGAGRTLATLADDQVTAEVMGEVAQLDAWRELEVELAPGSEDAALLDAVEKRLRKQGARRSKASSKVSRLLGDRVPRPASRARSSAGSVVVAYLERQADLLRGHDIGVRTGVDDSVHQMRVACRRLRSALSAFRRVLDRDATRTVADELKWLGGELSPVRDTEVLEERLRNQLRAQPSELVLGPVKASLTAHFARETAEGTERASAALESRRYTELLRALDKLLSAPPLTAKAERPARDELKRAVHRSARHLRNARKEYLRAAPGPERDAALHEVRKKAKQARYTGEAVRTVFGKHVKSWTKAVKEAQSVLGDHHDSVVTRDALRQLGVRAHLDGANAFTYGLLHRHNSAEAEALEQKFTEAWSTLRHLEHPRWLP
jgi:CHAD domain-containing protein